MTGNIKTNHIGSSNKEHSLDFNSYATVFFASKKQQLRRIKTI